MHIIPSTFGTKAKDTRALATSIYHHIYLNEDNKKIAENEAQISYKFKYILIFTRRDVGRAENKSKLIHEKWRKTEFDIQFDSISLAFIRENRTNNERNEPAFLPSRIQKFYN